MIAELAWLVALAIFIVLPVSWTFDVRGVRLGISHDHIHGNRPANRGNVYLERWIIWLPGVSFLGEDKLWSPRPRFVSYTLRLHKFHRADEESALHDHPWWFITFPLQFYIERYWNPSLWEYCYRVVKPFRFHFRAATFRHTVVGDLFPAYTFVLTGPKSNRWGFWPNEDCHVYWRDWFRQTGTQPASGTVGDDV